jgi:2'-5' RNA ligase
MPRLFVALRPPPEVRSVLLGVMGGIDGARWQNDNQLHLTLAFLGELDRHDSAAAAEALALVRGAALELKLGLPGSFDAARQGRTGTLWVGVQPVDGVSALAQAVRAALRRAELTPDARKFVPHITLARFGAAGASREAIRPWLAHAAFPAVSWAVTQFHLVESLMGAGGSHYVVVASYALG